LLIDFEYATTQSRSRALAPGSRTVRILFPAISNSHLSVSQGTAPFMAIELLNKTSATPHAAHHDLESLFYVLIYICTNLSGPGTIRTREELKVHGSIPLTAWFKASYSLNEIGISKSGALCDIKSHILRSFAPYFEDLKPCVMKLNNAIYSSPGVPRPVSHDKMIEIFTETLDSLPHETASIPAFESLTVTSYSRARKHSLGIHDRNLQKKSRTLSRDATKASESEPSGSNSNWAIIPNNGATSGQPGRSRGSRGRKSRSGRSGVSGHSISRPP
jgi:hypothetical protein